MNKKLNKNEFKKSDRSEIIKFKKSVDEFNNRRS